MRIQICIIILLLLISFIDIKTKRIPDYFTYTGLVIFLCYKTLIENQSILSQIALIIAGFLPFFLIWYFTRGKLGLGDAKYSALLALILGLHSWCFMLLISSVTALIFALYLLKFRKMARDVKIPYGPFLSIGAAVSLFIV